MTIDNYKDLIVWQKSIELADRVYGIIQKFPKEETYGLASQLSRSSVSVPSNIAEGSARGSRKEFAQFVSIARGSLAEVDTQLIISRNRKYLSDETYQSVLSDITAISKMSMRLLQALKQPVQADA